MKLTIGTQVGTYTIFKHLGQENSRTYMALGTRSIPAAVKVLPTDCAPPVEALAALRDPNVAKFQKLTEHDLGGKACLLFVEAFVKGESLATWVERGRAIDEVECSTLLDTMLDTLAALHTATPPVFHGAIDLDNIVVGTEGEPILVGFDHARSEGTGEEDISALGRTMAGLVTLRDPSELKMVDGVLQFHELTSASDAIIASIDGMVSSDPTQRFHTAEAAREFRRTFEKRLRFGEGRRSFVEAKSISAPHKRAIYPYVIMALMLVIIAAIWLAK